MTFVNVKSEIVKLRITPLYMYRRSMWILRHMRCVGIWACCIQGDTNCLLASRAWGNKMKREVLLEATCLPF